MRRKLPIIPVKMLLEGCLLCLSNVMQFAKEADLLLQKNFQTHAFALVILGFRELGKFGILLEYYVEAFQNNAKEIQVKEFFDHNLKMHARMKHYLTSEKELHENMDDKALLEIPSTEEERYWKRVFKLSSFAKSVRMLEGNGEGARLAATYVDFDQEKKKWAPPRSPKKEIIEANRRLLESETFSLDFMLRIKSPEVTLMA